MRIDVLRCFSTIPKTMRCVDITKYGGPEVRYMRVGSWM